ncbi:MAG: ferritin-like domain-containing protein [Actinomycetota bacterium]|nr:ferritin-like domain-containing protein [Actinomycetota bacterium]
MAELDGIWMVERTGGVLPPLYGVLKRISGDRGETLVAGRIGVPFEVRGLELRYTGPLTGFVDVLEPAGADFRGRTTYRGRDIGRFVMRRQDVNQQLKGQLVKHIGEAHAMEQNVIRMLDSMIATTEDPDIVEALRLHRVETEEHRDRMARRLEAHGESPSVVKDVGGIMGALMKGVVDIARGERAGRNARDGYATEHMEIASYQLLERVARRAGDEETAQAAAQNRADEERMAKVFEDRWERFTELSLEEAGVKV